jgi:hypothetical protein
MKIKIITVKIHLLLLITINKYIIEWELKNAQKIRKIILKINKKMNKRTWGIRIGMIKNY